MTEVPNLDCFIDPDEVWAYWVQWNGRPVKVGA